MEAAFDISRFKGREAAATRADDGLISPVGSETSVSHTGAPVAGDTAVSPSADTNIHPFFPVLYSEDNCVLGSHEDLGASAAANAAERNDFSQYLAARSDLSFLQQRKQQQVLHYSDDFILRHSHLQSVLQQQRIAMHQHQYRLEAQQHRLDPLQQQQHMNPQAHHLGLQQHPNLEIQTHHYLMLQRANMHQQLSTGEGVDMQQPQEEPAPLQPQVEEDHQHLDHHQEQHQLFDHGDAYASVCQQTEKEENFSQERQLMHRQQYYQQQQQHLPHRSLLRQHQRHESYNDASKTRWANADVTVVPSATVEPSAAASSPDDKFRQQVDTSITSSSLTDVPYVSHDREVSEGYDEAVARKKEVSVLSTAATISNSAGGFFSCFNGPTADLHCAAAGATAAPVAVSPSASSSSPASDTLAFVYPQQLLLQQQSTAFAQMALAAAAVVQQRQQVGCLHRDTAAVTDSCTVAPAMTPASVPNQQSALHRTSSETATEDFSQAVSHIISAAGFGAVDPSAALSHSAAEYARPIGVAEFSASAAAMPRPAAAGDDSAQQGSSEALYSRLSCQPQTPSRTSRCPPPPSSPASVISEATLRAAPETAAAGDAAAAGNAAAKAGGEKAAGELAAIAGQPAPPHIHDAGAPAHTQTAAATRHSSSAAAFATPAEVLLAKAGATAFPTAQGTCHPTGEKEARATGVPAITSSSAVLANEVPLPVASVNEAELPKGHSYFEHCSRLREKSLASPEASSCAGAAVTSCAAAVALTPERIVLNHVVGDGRLMLEQLDVLRSGASKDLYKKERIRVVEELIRQAVLYPKVSGIYFDKHQLRWSVGWAQHGRRVAKYFPVKIFGLAEGYRLAVHFKQVANAAAASGNLCAAAAFVDGAAASYSATPCVAGAAYATSDIVPLGPQGQYTLCERATATAAATSVSGTTMALDHGLQQRLTTAAAVAPSCTSSPAAAAVLSQQQQPGIQKYFTGNNHVLQQQLQQLQQLPPAAQALFLKQQQFLLLQQLQQKQQQQTAHHLLCGSSCHDALPVGFQAATATGRNGCLNNIAAVAAARQHELMFAGAAAAAGPCSGLYSSSGTEELQISTAAAARGGYTPAATNGSLGVSSPLLQQQRVSLALGDTGVAPTSGLHAERSPSKTKSAETTNFASEQQQHFLYTLQHFQRQQQDRQEFQSQHQFSLSPASPQHRAFSRYQQHSPQPQPQVPYQQLRFQQQLELQQQNQQQQQQVRHNQQQQNNRQLQQHSQRQQEEQKQHQQQHYQQKQHACPQQSQQEEYHSQQMAYCNVDENSSASFPQFSVSGASASVPLQTSQFGVADVAACVPATETLSTRTSSLSKAALPLIHSHEDPQHAPASLLNKTSLLSGSAGDDKVDDVLFHVTMMSAAAAENAFEPPAMPGTAAINKQEKPAATAAAGKETCSTTVKETSGPTEETTATTSALKNSTAGDGPITAEHHNRCLETRRENTGSTRSNSMSSNCGSDRRSNHKDGYEEKQSHINKEEAEEEKVKEKITPCDRELQNTKTNGRGSNVAGETFSPVICRSGFSHGEQSLSFQIHSWSGSSNNRGSIESNFCASSNSAMEGVLIDNRCNDSRSKPGDREREKSSTDIRKRPFPQTSAAGEVVDATVDTDTIPEKPSSSICSQQPSCHRTPHLLEIAALRMKFLFENRDTTDTQQQQFLNAAQNQPQQHLQRRQPTLQQLQQPLRQQQPVEQQQHLHRQHLQQVQHLQQQQYLQQSQQQEIHSSEEVESVDSASSSKSVRNVLCNGVCASSRDYSRSIKARASCNVAENRSSNDGGSSVSDSTSHGSSSRSNGPSKSSCERGSSSDTRTKCCNAGMSGIANAVEFLQDRIRSQRHQPHVHLELEAGEVLSFEQQLEQQQQQIARLPLLPTIVRQKTQQQLTVEDQGDQSAHRVGAPNSPGAAAVVTAMHPEGRNPEVAAEPACITFIKNRNNSRDCIKYMRKSQEKLSPCLQMPSLEESKDDGNDTSTTANSDHNSSNRKEMMRGQRDSTKNTCSNGIIKDASEGSTQQGNCYLQNCDRAVIPAADGLTAGSEIRTATGTPESEDSSAVVAVTNLSCKERSESRNGSKKRKRRFVVEGKTTAEEQFNGAVSLNRKMERIMTNRSPCQFSTRSYTEEQQRCSPVAIESEENLFICKRTRMGNDVIIAAVIDEDVSTVATESCTGVLRAAGATTEVGTPKVEAASEAAASEAAASEAAVLNQAAARTSAAQLQGASAAAAPAKTASAAATPAATPLKETIMSAVAAGSEAASEELQVGCTDLDFEEQKGGESLIVSEMSSPTPSLLGETATSPLKSVVSASVSDHLEIPDIILRAVAISRKACYKVAQEETVTAAAKMFPEDTGCFTSTHKRRQPAGTAGGLTVQEGSRAGNINSKEKSSNVGICNGIPHADANAQIIAGETAATSYRDMGMTTAGQQQQQKRTQPQEATDRQERNAALSLFEAPKASEEHRHPLQGKKQQSLRKTLAAAAVCAVGENKSTAESSAAKVQAPEENNCTGVLLPSDNSASASFESIALPSSICTATSGVVSRRPAFTTTAGSSNAMLSAADAACCSSGDHATTASTTPAGRGGCSDTSTPGISSSSFAGSAASLAAAPCAPLTSDSEAVLKYYLPLCSSCKVNLPAKTADTQLPHVFLGPRAQLLLEMPPSYCAPSSSASSFCCQTFSSAVSPPASSNRSTAQRTSNASTAAPELEKSCFTTAASLQTTSFAAAQPSSLYSVAASSTATSSLDLRPAKRNDPVAGRDCAAVAALWNVTEAFSQENPLSTIAKKERNDVYLSNVDMPSSVAAALTDRAAGRDKHNAGTCAAAVASATLTARHPVSEIASAKCPVGFSATPAALQKTAMVLPATVAAVTERSNAYRRADDLSTARAAHSPNAQQPDFLSSGVPTPYDHQQEDLLLSPASFVGASAPLAATEVKNLSSFPSAEKRSPCTKQAVPPKFAAALTYRKQKEASAASCQTPTRNQAADAAEIQGDHATRERVATAAALKRENDCSISSGDSSSPLSRSTITPGRNSTSSSEAKSISNNGSCSRPSANHADENRTDDSSPCRRKDSSSSACSTGGTFSRCSSISSPLEQQRNVSSPKVSSFLGPALSIDAKGQVSSASVLHNYEFTTTPATTRDCVKRQQKPTDCAFTSKNIVAASVHISSAAGVHTAPVAADYTFRDGAIARTLPATADFDVFNTETAPNSSVVATHLPVVSTSSSCTNAPAAIFPALKEATVLAARKSVHAAGVVFQRNFSDASPTAAQAAAEEQTGLKGRKTASEETEESIQDEVTALTLQRLSGETTEQYRCAESDRPPAAAVVAPHSSKSGHSFPGTCTLAHKTLEAATQRKRQQAACLLTPSIKEGVNENSIAALLAAATTATMREGEATAGLRRAAGSAGSTIAGSAATALAAAGSAAAASAAAGSAAAGSAAAQSAAAESARAHIYRRPVETASTAKADAVTSLHERKSLANGELEQHQVQATVAHTSFRTAAFSPRSLKLICGAAERQKFPYTLSNYSKSEAVGATASPLVKENAEARVGREELARRGTKSVALGQGKTFVQQQYVLSALAPSAEEGARVARPAQGTGTITEAAVTELVRDSEQRVVPAAELRRRRKRGVASRGKVGQRVAAENAFDGEALAAEKAEETTAARDSEATPPRTGNTCVLSNRSEKAFTTAIEKGTTAATSGIQPVLETETVAATAVEKSVVGYYTRHESRAVQEAATAIATNSDISANNTARASAAQTNLPLHFVSSSISSASLPSPVYTHTTGIHFDKHSLRWKATWYDGSGQRKAKYFPVGKYGYEEARRLAIQARSENHVPRSSRFAAAHSQQHAHLQQRLLQQQQQLITSSTTVQQQFVLEQNAATTAASCCTLSVPSGCALLQPVTTARAPLMAQQQYHEINATISTSTNDVAARMVTTDTAQCSRMQHHSPTNRLQQQQQAQQQRLQQQQHMQDQQFQQHRLQQQQLQQQQLQQQWLHQQHFQQQQCQQQQTQHQDFERHQVHLHHQQQLLYQHFPSEVQHQQQQEIPQQQEERQSHLWQQQQQSVEYFSHKDMSLSCTSMEGLQQSHQIMTEQLSASIQHQPQQSLTQQHQQQLQLAGTHPQQKQRQQQLEESEERETQEHHSVQREQGSYEEQPQQRSMLSYCSGNMFTNYSNSPCQKSSVSPVSAHEVNYLADADAYFPLASTRATDCGLTDSAVPSTFSFIKDAPPNFFAPASEGNSPGETATTAHSASAPTATSSPLPLSSGVHSTGNSSTFMYGKYSQKGYIPALSEKLAAAFTAQHQQQHCVPLLQCAHACPEAATGQAADPTRCTWCSSYNSNDGSTNRSRCTYAGEGSSRCSSTGESYSNADYRNCNGDNNNENSRIQHDMHRGNAFSSAKGGGVKMAAAIASTHNAEAPTLTSKNGEKALSLETNVSPCRTRGSSRVNKAKRGQCDSRKRRPHSRCSRWQ